MQQYYGPYYYAKIEINGSVIDVFGERHDNAQQCDSQHNIVQYITEKLQQSQPPDIFVEMPVGFKLSDDNAVPIQCTYLSTDILNSLRSCMLSSHSEYVHFTDIRDMLGHLPYQQNEKELLQQEFNLELMASDFLFPILFAIEFANLYCLQWNGTSYCDQMLKAMREHNTAQCIQVYHFAIDSVYEEYLFKIVLNCTNKFMIVYNGSAHAMRLVNMLQERKHAIVTNEQHNVESCVRI
jgi:hypothetical protein